MMKLNNTGTGVQESAKTVSVCVKNYIKLSVSSLLRCEITSFAPGILPVYNYP